MGALTAEAIIALIQMLTAYMRANGVDEEEIDRVMEEGRAKKKARPVGDLPDAGGA